MRKTNEGNQTRKKEQNRVSVTAWKPVPSSFFMLPRAERPVSVSADHIRQEPRGQETSSLRGVSQHPQSVTTQQQIHTHQNLNLATALFFGRVYLH